MTTNLNHKWGFFILIVATIGSLSGGTSPAMAEVEFGLEYFGGRLGMVSLGSGLADAGSALSLEGCVGFGRLTPRIKMEGYIRYWSKSQTIATGIYVAGGKWKLSNLGFGGRAKYHFSPAEKETQPFAGAGLGIHFQKSSWESNYFFEDYYGGGATSLGIDLGGGVAHRINEKMDLLAELWYTPTTISQFSIAVGLAF